MQTQSPIFDEIAKLMSEAAGAVDGVRREAETVARGQLQRLLSDMDLVPREEFEVVREMAVAARAENERLSARIAELEARLGKTS
ncbi:MAG: accessory factor UbiK family protein [Parvularculaceae bacterium]|nr:accessory factor UbiK family protein [Parvularculaceae bacterium]